MRGLSYLFFVFAAVLFTDVHGAVSLEEMRAAYMAARGGGKDVGQVDELISTFLKENPSDPLALVYKGSLKTIQGRDASMPWQKLVLVNEGFDLLDKAIAQIANARVRNGYDIPLEILIVSGFTNAAVPKSFGRRPLAERDLSHALNSKSFGMLSREDKAAVYAWLAVLCSERSEQEGQKYLVAARGIHPEVAERIWRKR